ncbi:cysteine hydrolase family protein [Flavisphingomonas formosensis]|uniref:cysteine hydrolase family protein n=1 Tax=Flavisphingomonas formosensis TaxID=861534 RepID=UPI0012FCB1C4|nr:isochorismatase family cysteine hydrolase [Sphingomonas formosensis]
MRNLVIVVDMQRDFVLPDHALPVPEAAGLIASMRDWLAALDARVIEGVLFTFDTHEPERYAASPEGAQFPIHCVRGTPGWDLVVDPADVPAAIPVWRLEKGVFDMWAEPDAAIRNARDDTAPPQDREAFFAALKARGVDHVTVIGVAADFCVRWAIEGLAARGFVVTVPAALTRGIERPIDAVAEAHFGGMAVSVTE